MVSSPLATMSRLVLSSQLFAKKLQLFDGGWVIYDWY